MRKVPQETAKSKGVGVRNAFAMTIPVIISEDFNKNYAQTRVNQRTDEVGYGVPKVVGEVSNQAPSMFGQIKVDAWVTEKENGQALSVSIRKYEMAPILPLNIQ